MSELNEVNSEKRKNRSYSVLEKLDVIRRIEYGDSAKSVCDELRIPRRTVRYWISCKEKLREYAKTYDLTPNVKRIKLSPFEQMDEALFLWFKRNVRNGISLTGPNIMAKARELHEYFKIEKNFSASEGWLSNWKRKYNVHGYTKQNSNVGDSDESDAIPSNADLLQMFSKVFTAVDVKPDIKDEFIQANITGEFMEVTVKEEFIVPNMKEEVDDESNVKNRREELTKRETENQRKKRELEEEMKKRRLEEEVKKQKLEEEIEKRQLENEIKKQQLENEMKKQQLENEIKKQQLEYEMKRREIEEQRRQQWYKAIQAREAADVLLRFFEQNHVLTREQTNLLNEVKAVAMKIAAENS